MNFGIIAAGEGSRLAAEGVEYPKPLVPICGVPMIGRLIRIFERCGAKQISIVVNEQMTEVAEYLRGFECAPGVKLDITVKTTPSSMHSMHELASRLRGKGRFIVTTVDTIFREEDFAAYAADFEKAPAEVDGMMAVTGYVDDEKPLWVGTDADMRITAFRDSRDPEDRYISGGIYGLDSKAFETLDHCVSQGVSRMRNFQRALVADGLNLRAYNLGKVLDVDHASDIEKAELFLKAE
ncbi:MAG: NTP transferase domain-containing protein [Muribaculaceae bacterium]|nr:NTP transferase domain-containing protein [Muribaculaceae bacterium]